MGNEFNVKLQTKGSRKKVIFLVVGQLRGGEGVKAQTTEGKTTFFENHLKITHKSYDHYPGGGGGKCLSGPITKKITFFAAFLIK